MRTRAISVALAVPILAVSSILPASADSTPVTGGSLSVPSMILADDYCVEIPVAYDFTGMAADWSWNLAMTSAAGIDVDDLGQGGVTGSTTAQWCPDDLPGPFTLTGTLTVQDADYTTVATQPVSLNFTVQRRSTTATLRASKTAPKAGELMTLKGCVAAAGHRDPDRGIAIQYRKPGGTWHQLETDSTDQVGCYDETNYPKKPGVTYLRVHVPATNSRTGAYSKTVTITAKK